MDVQQAIAPHPPKAAQPEMADKVKDAVLDKAQGPDFSQLLQGMQHADVALPTDAEGVTVLPVESLGDAAVGMWDVQSLLGQTRHLDTVDVDAMAQDGSLLQVQQDRGLASTSIPWGAQPQMATGQAVATVAAGVQAHTAAVGSGAAMAVLAEGMQVVDGVAQSTSEAVDAETASDSEGRVVLQGAWKLDDAQPPSPPLQRLLGQIEQWAVASAGVQPKPSERLESGKNLAHAAEWLSADQGSGTRLTENAVSEAQAAQDVAMEPQTEAPVEDLRFWLQGKLQRAEVVLDKDGQSVRVQVSVRGNEAQVLLQSDELHTRARLDASLEQLREMLEKQGVQLTGVSVQAQAQDPGQRQGSDARNPWQAGVAHHAHVVVPQDEAAAVARDTRSQGLSLYA